MKIKWKVSEPPSGRFASFHKREWPSAYYNDAEGEIAAWIICETGEDYIPHNVKTGEHGPLKIYVADYSKNDGNSPWTRKVMKKRFDTLKDAKQGFAKLVKDNPQIMPKGDNNG